jgi:hypothetical protein
VDAVVFERARRNWIFLNEANTIFGTTFSNFGKSG